MTTNKPGAPVEKRIIVTAPDALHRALKSYAAQQGVTIGSIVLSLVEQRLREQNALPTQYQKSA